jgi:hypothetical protein
MRQNGGKFMRSEAAAFDQMFLEGKNAALGHLQQYQHIGPSFQRNDPWLRHSIGVRRALFLLTFLNGGFSKIPLMFFPSSPLTMTPFF